jgi:hypothetical protein
MWACRSVKSHNIHCHVRSRCDIFQKRSWFQHMSARDLQSEIRRSRIRCAFGSARVSHGMSTCAINSSFDSPTLLLSRLTRTFLSAKIKSTLRIGNVRSCSQRREIPQDRSMFPKVSCLHTPIWRLVRTLIVCQSINQSYRSPMSAVLKV